MNNNYRLSNKSDINLTDFGWNLIMQWKAILIVCIAVALLVMGARYHIDSNAYKDSLARIAEAKKTASISVDERIAETLESLPEDEAYTVQLIAHQMDYISLQKKYLNDSIWINTDPTNQRVLAIQYYLQRGDISDLQMLVDSYTICLQKTESIASFREVISPNAPIHFILELFSAYGGAIADNEVGSTIYTVSFVLPEDIDAEAVVNVADSNISSIYKELKASLGDHSIVRVNAEDYHTYSSPVTDRRNNISNSINNLNNFINNTKNTLNEKQLAAL